MTVRSGGGLHCSLELALDGQALAMHHSLGWQQARAAPGSRMVPPAQTQEPGPTSSAFARMAAYVGGGVQLYLGNTRYCRVPLPTPGSLLPALGEPPGMALLRRCQVGRKGDRRYGGQTLQRAGGEPPVAPPEPSGKPQPY